MRTFSEVTSAKTKKVDLSRKKKIFFAPGNYAQLKIDGGRMTWRQKGTQTGRQKDRKKDRQTDKNFYKGVPLLKMKS